MLPFEGFSRRAIVIVPEDEEYKSRLEKQQKLEGKEVPEKAIYEMKGRARCNYCTLSVAHTICLSTCNRWLLTLRMYCLWCTHAHALLPLFSKCEKSDIAWNRALSDRFPRKALVTKTLNGHTSPKLANSFMSWYGFTFKNISANFTVPDVGMLFDEVEFTELDRDASEKLVEQYREEGQKNLPPPPEPTPPPEKRFKESGYNDRGGGRSKWVSKKRNHLFILQGFKTHFAHNCKETRMLTKSVYWTDF